MCQTILSEPMQLQVLVPSRALASKHYAEHEGKPFFDGLVSFLSSGSLDTRLPNLTSPIPSGACCQSHWDCNNLEKESLVRPCSDGKRVVAEMIWRDM